MLTLISIMGTRYQLDIYAHSLRIRQNPKTL